VAGAAAAPGRRHPWRRRPTDAPAAAAAAQAAAACGCGCGRRPRRRTPQWRRRGRRRRRRCRRQAAAALPAAAPPRRRALRFCSVVRHAVAVVVARAAARGDRLGVSRAVAPPRRRRDGIGDSGGGGGRPAGARVCVCAAQPRFHLPRSHHGAAAQRAQLRIGQDGVDGSGGTPPVPLAAVRGGVIRGARSVQVAVARGGGIGRELVEGELSPLCRRCRAAAQRARLRDGEGRRCGRGGALRTHLAGGLGDCEGSGSVREGSVLVAAPLLRRGPDAFDFPAAGTSARRWGWGGLWWRGMTVVAAAEAARRCDTHG